MNRRESLAALAALAAMPAAGAGPVLALASDFRGDGEAARASRVPIVVLFSLPGCPYCEEIRRSHLVPMTKDPRRAGRALVRQVDVNSDKPVVGFRGEATTHARVAAAHGVKLAPVVHFWSPRGEPVAAPLVGMLLPDFYAAYLEAGLDEARAAIAGGA